MTPNRLTLPLYLAASATSLFGNAAITIVLPWLVLSRTGDPAITGLVAAASAAPAAIAALVGGHLVDRIGRRTVCVISDAGSALSVAALAVVDALVGLDVFWFITLGILGALFDVPGMTARQAMLADVAETSGVALDKVASIVSAVFALSFLAGPALAGLLLATLPAIQVVWVTAVCSALAAVLIGLTPLRHAGAPEPTTEHHSPLAGFAIIRRDGALLTLLIIQLASMLFVAPLLGVLLPAHFRTLGRPEELGLSLSAYAVGSMAGAGLYGWLFAKRRLAAWITANALYVVALALIATLAGFWPVAAGMAIAGVAAGLQAPITQVLPTERVPDAVRGRVFGLYSALSSLASPVGLALFAVLLLGAPLQTGAIAIAVACAVAAAYAIWSPPLRAYLRTSPGPAAAQTPDPPVTRTSSRRPN